MIILYIIAALLAAILITMLGAWEFVGGLLGLLLFLIIPFAVPGAIGGLLKAAGEWINLLLAKIPLKTFQIRALKRELVKRYELGHSYSFATEKQRQEFEEIKQALKDMEAGKQKPNHGVGTDAT
jgi:hypothetical protein